MMSQFDKAVFAGGCFWCMVQPFDEMDGVEAVISGYTAGDVENPTYEQVKTGTTGHTEAVEITFDPEKISYQQLLDIYWSSMDPTDATGQFFDRGSSYRPAVFVNSEEQRELAQASKEALDASGRFSKPVVVPIEDVHPFYPAEDYHQDFYKKNPDHYNRYSTGSGRVAFIEEHQV